MKKPSTSSSNVETPLQSKVGSDYARPKSSKSRVVDTRSNRTDLGKSTTASKRSSKTNHDSYREEEQHPLKCIITDRKSNPDRRSRDADYSKSTAASIKYSPGYHSTSDEEQDSLKLTVNSRRCSIPEESNNEDADHNKFAAAAKRYSPVDLERKPSYPGDGHNIDTECHRSSTARIYSNTRGLSSSYEVSHRKFMDTSRKSPKLENSNSRDEDYSKSTVTDHGSSNSILSESENISLTSRTARINTQDDNRSTSTTKEKYEHVIVYFIETGY